VRWTVSRKPSPGCDGGGYSTVKEVVASVLVFPDVVVTVTT
jgi:hypothetical protein